MQFLAPLFWIAAVAVSVPVFLHLTRREVKRPIPFASLMFLRRIPVQEFRRRRIRHWLLLALRCLALLALVAAFSQPVVDRSVLVGVGQPSEESVLLLVDTSLSMSRPGVRERTSEAIQEVSRSLKSQSELAVVRFNTRAEISQPWTRDRAQLDSLLSAGFETSFDATNYSSGLRAALPLLEDAHNALKRIVLVSDLQASGLDETFSEVQIPADVSVDVRDVGEESKNLFIEDVRMERDIYSDRYPHPVVVRIASSGISEDAEGAAVLRLSDQIIDRRSFTVEPGGSVTVTFDPFEIPEGVTRGRIHLEVSDDLEADDTWYFTLERGEPFEVILVEAKGTEEDSLFFRQALASGVNLPFSARVAPFPAEPDPLQTPVVVLNNLPNLPRADRLLRFVSEGGGLIVTLGADARADRYAEAVEQLLPATLGNKHYGLAGGSQFVALGTLADEHPVFAGFRQTGATALSAVRFYGYWQVQPTTEGRVLASFTSGMPALLERQIGRGRSLLFASSLNRVWSDFPLRSSYLPFWQELVLYAAGWRPRSAQVHVGEVFSPTEWSLAHDTAATLRWDILDPRGRRLRSLGEEASSFFVLEVPGYYELRHEKSTNWFAVNTIPVESDLARLEAAELESAFRKQQIAPGQAPALGPRPETTEYPVWWLFLILAAMLFLLETYFANRAAGRVGSSGAPA